MRRRRARRDHIREKEEILRKRRSGRRIVWVLVAWLVLRTFWVLAFRFQVRTVIDEVRAFNKRILNPAMMKLAGRRHWYASVIRHRGRRSGKEYATPVVAELIEEDFIVPLPYGENVDWLKNVIAAGRATIAAKGETYAVGEPEIIDAGAAFSLLRPRVRHKWRLFGIGRWLKVKRLPDCAAPEDRPDGFARIERPSS